GERERVVESPVHDDGRGAGGEASRPGARRSTEAASVAADDDAVQRDVDVAAAVGSVGLRHHRDPAGTERHDVAGEIESDLAAAADADGADAEDADHRATAAA